MAWLPDPEPAYQAPVCPAPSLRPLLRDPEARLWLDELRLCFRLLGQDDSGDVVRGRVE